MFYRFHTASSHVQHSVITNCSKLNKRNGVRVSNGIAHTKFRKNRSSVSKAKMGETQKNTYTNKEKQ